MLIYLFAEHYPNPYKPQFDTEFAYLIRSGNDLRIFAGGSFEDVIQPRVAEYGLDKLTARFITNRQAALTNLHRIFWRILRHPWVSISRAKKVWDRALGLKRNLIRSARAVMLPAREPDVCYVHNLATASYLDFLSLIYPNSSNIMYFHGGEVGGVSRIAREEELFRPMQLVFTNTEFCRQQAIGRGCPPDKALVLPVGFDLPDYPQLPGKLYFANRQIRLISIGRLSEEKGLQYALDAVAHLKQTTFLNISYVIVGRGLLEDELRRHVDRTGLRDIVRFVGEKTKTEIVDLLSESDILILPSVTTATWAETQGAVVQEAMFMQTIVISTATGGVPECIPDTMRRFSVQPAHSLGIAEAIREISALEAEELTDIAAKARQFAAAKFDIEVTGKTLLANIAAIRPHA